MLNFLKKRLAVSRTITANQIRKNQTIIDNTNQMIAKSKKKQ